MQGLTMGDEMTRKKIPAEALEWSYQLDMLRRRRHALVSDAFAMYGDKGSLISGVERDHFPEPVKDSLRNNARAIAQVIDHLGTTWRKYGKRMHTLRRFLAEQPRHGSRY